jgi:ribonuclease HI
MKLYAVKRGRTIGVFDSWTSCNESIKGFSGAEFKSFNTQEEAEAYIKDIDIIFETVQNDIDQGFIVAFCDGGYDEKKDRYSYGVVIIDAAMQEHEICGSSRNEKYISSKNIIGEVLGVINALDWALSNGYEKIKIYHDYEGLSRWISEEWKAESEVAKMYVSIFKNKFAGLLHVEFNKVKGHSNNKYNDKADELATRALNDNARVPVTGDSWFSIPYFKHEELRTIMDLISEYHNDIRINENQKPNSVVYKLELDNHKLSVTLFNNGNKKLLVQGSNTILFQIFVTYVNELLGLNADQVLANAYRQKIDSKIIDSSYGKLCPTFSADYPENIKRLIRQSIINLSYYVECEDYSQYVFPALKALEGHMKYLFNKAGKTIASKQSFSFFIKDPSSNIFSLPATEVSDPELRRKLEEYYNYYYVTRHTMFHFGDILGATDTTRIIETKEEADAILKKTLSYICEE